MPRNNGVKKKAKDRTDEIGKLGARTGGHSYGSLGQTADNEKATEQTAQNIGRPVRDQLLVRVDIAATLHCRGLRSTERLGIADQHDGERAGRELPQYCRIKVGESEMKQTGREVADHAYTGGLAAQ